MVYFPGRPQIGIPEGQATIAPPSTPAPAPATDGGAPEAALQLALDQVSLADAGHLVSRLAPVLSRVEIGTPLAIAEGLSAIEGIRRLSRPGTTIVADVKICDAGEKIARSAFAAGADVITVVAAAIDEVTWHGVLSAAAGRSGGPAPVLVDTIGGGLASGALGTLAGAAAEAGVRVDLCVHRPKAASPGFAALAGPVARHDLGFDRLAVAGRLGPEQVRPALEAGFDTLIVGGAVANADDPLAMWNMFRAGACDHVPG